MQPNSGVNAPLPTEECDIVMKGGITSGVVYPSAVLALCARYRFRSIGGASVGAIAAATTAAAEYGRQTGRGTGFEQLNVMNDELAREGFLLSLFKPRSSAGGLYAIYLAAVGKGGPAAVFTAVLRQARWVIVPLLGWWATLVAVAWLMGDAWWVVPVLLAAWVVLIFLLAVVVAGRGRPVGVWLGLGLAVGWPLLFAVPSVGVRSWNDLSRSGFGLVPGSGGGGALCDWLHHHIQAAAGLSEDEPLTFRMLADDLGADGEPVGVDLQMTTTNLSTARPMRLPRDMPGYLFAPDDLRDVMPAAVLHWLNENGTHDSGLVRLPVDGNLPVLLAFRLSMSFPALFTAVRLHAPALETGRADAVPHWFSDGGIGSNFPVHLFDRWMPRRPTFALSFAPFPVTPDGRVVAGETDVGLPPAPNEERLPRWVPISDVGGFAAQILETMQNWRDTMQAELPGFRERVYEARLDKPAGEGGLNLGMDAKTIMRLQERGRRVGIATAATFDMDQHFFTRYLVAMQQLEIGLVGRDDGGAGRDPGGVGRAFGPRKGAFDAGDVGAGELFGRDPAWLSQAGGATWDLVERARSWTAFGRFVSDQPRPQPVKRIIPDV